MAFVLIGTTAFVVSRPVVSVLLAWASSAVAEMAQLAIGPGRIVDRVITDIAHARGQREELFPPESVAAPVAVTGSRT